MVNGDIYGFIAFVNVLSINSTKEFSTKHVVLALFNFDLGIEVCFYNGMTAYIATWLEFAFPLYLLCIIAVLVVASRYSVKIERLARKKVIPVIATIFLLSYNKIMIVTFNVLFSYSIIHHLHSKKTTMCWDIDTGISLFGVFHLLLVLFCVILLLFVIIPINALLIYAKLFYNFRFIVSRLKPFIDAYTAPLKDCCRYFLGLEFLLRAAVYVIKHVWPNQGAIVYSIISVAFIAYLCRFQPFKHAVNNLIYFTYILCLNLISILFMHYSVMKSEPSKNYVIMVAVIVQVALAVFGLIVVYHIWKFILCRYRIFIKLETYLLAITMKYSLRFCTKKPTDNVQRSMDRYEEYQEELLVIDS